MKNSQISQELDETETVNRDISYKLQVAETKIKRTLEDYRLIQRRLESMQKRALDLL